VNRKPPPRTRRAALTRSGDCTAGAPLSSVWPVSENRPGTTAIRVAIVEDDDLLRSTLMALIDGADGVTCTAAYASGEDALAGIPREPADVILMDIMLPGMSGIDCVRQLKAVLPDVDIIMLTMFEDEGEVLESVRAGASGYLLKRTPQAMILDAITTVNAGGSPMTSSIARKVVQLLGHPPPAPQTPDEDLASLSPREVEILNCLAQGHRYKEIAEKLGISVETVRTHLRRIYKKLQVSSRTEAAVKFLKG
jgi:DNA-binding NarL/FixJ family response regulator